MILILSVQIEHPSSGAANTYTGQAGTPQLFWEFPAMTTPRVTVWVKYASGLDESGRHASQNWANHPFGKQNAGTISHSGVLMMKQ